MWLWEQSLVYCKLLYHEDSLTKSHDGTGISLRDHSKFSPVTVLCFFLTASLRCSSHTIYNLSTSHVTFNSFWIVIKFWRQLLQSITGHLNTGKIILTLSRHCYILILSYTLLIHPTPASGCHEYTFFF